MSALLNWSSRKVRRVKRIISERRMAALEKEVIESQWLSEDLLRRRQLFQVKKLLKHAYRTTRYYRELFDRIGLRVSDIRSLSDYAQAVPVLDRSTVREQFEDLISSEWKSRHRIMQTSGSTGTPMKFAHPVPFPMQRASRAQVKDILGLRGDERTLSLWGADLGEDRYHTFDRKRNVAYFSFYSMPPGGFEELLDFIVRWRPEFVFGYVSVLYIVAEALEKRGHSSLGVRVIRTHAEKLYGFQRAKIEQVFGGEAYDHYGSREISDYGMECREHNGLHLFSNLRLFELESTGERNRNTGQVLVTDFANYAMPFLRYRIGDVITIDRQPCRCGRSLPRAWVEGRTIDLIRLRDGRLCYSVILSKLMDPEQVSHFLIHQRTLDRIDVHIVPTASFTDSYRDYLIRRIQDKTKVEDIRVLLEKEIDVTIAAKHRLVRSDVSARMMADEKEHREA
jgi:phenylacetate-CoA ligase